MKEGRGAGGAPFFVFPPPLPPIPKNDGARNRVRTIERLTTRLSVLVTDSDSFVLDMPTLLCAPHTLTRRRRQSR